MGKIPLETHINLHKALISKKGEFEIVEVANVLFEYLKTITAAASEIPKFHYDYCKIEFFQYQIKHLEDLLDKYKMIKQDCNYFVANLNEQIGKITSSITHYSEQEQKMLKEKESHAKEIEAKDNIE